MQTPYGDSGQTTFFIASQADWDEHAVDMAREELNYELEAMSQQMFADAYAGDPDIYVPNVIMATGRSDYPNQVNNVLGFPFIFRGALDVRAKRINEEMKVAAANALSSARRFASPVSGSSLERRSRSRRTSSTSSSWTSAIAAARRRRNPVSCGRPAAGRRVSAPSAVMAKSPARLRTDADGGRPLPGERAAHDRSLNEEGLP